nr:putative nucleotidyltransferase, ribonuclease H [Tanacetum cinerariifolium]GFA61276.1 putative nucleotidyltransferase, ribonuclease H [Tanacetum cinerariifolium]
MASMCRACDGFGERLLVCSLSFKNKKYRGLPVPVDSMMLPQCDKKGTLLKQPLKLLDMRIAKKRNRVVVYGLVHWSNGTTKDASWEDLEKLVKDFPAFDVSS